MQTIKRLKVLSYLNGEKFSEVSEAHLSQKADVNL
jgi:hypothetical protein